MTEILLAVAITLLLVLIFLYLRNRPSEDAGAEIQAVSERMERTVRGKTSNPGQKPGRIFTFPKGAERRYGPPGNTFARGILNRSGNRSSSFRPISTQDWKRISRLSMETIRGAFQPDGQIFSRTERTHNSRTEGYYRDTR